MHKDTPSFDKQIIRSNLQNHVTMLTRTIGERSVRVPGNIEKSAGYIQAQFEEYGLEVRRQTYAYAGNSYSNILAKMRLSENPTVHYVLGAHYDSVAGTVGADDNASAVAVLLETARALKQDTASGQSALEITYVAFALEEPPAYGTDYMGSRVFAASAEQARETIDGMICLEMVGYTCHEPGCQRYPFPLQFFGYPKTGNFIGIVGNVDSLPFSRGLRKSFLRNPNLPVVSLTVPFNGWVLPAVRLSDHASFWDKGYRAVMVTDSAFFRNPHYHLPSDTMETLDFDFMAELVISLTTYYASVTN
ncbi:MAG: M28 family peptidase [Desulfosarcinaceae bacterium]|nr:M28 family peptidase [Desulfosarcinaceae bacterium]